jgi:hypothetical protein
VVDVAHGVLHTASHTQQQRQSRRNNSGAAAAAAAAAQRTLSPAVHEGGKPVVDVRHDVLNTATASEALSQQQYQQQQQGLLPVSTR